MFDFTLELPPRHELGRKKAFQPSLRPRVDIGKFRFCRLDRALFRRNRTGCYLLMTDNPEIGALR